MKESIVQIFKQPIKGKHRLIISSDFVEIICSNSAYNLFNIICFEDGGASDSLYDPFVLLQTEADVMMWLSTLALDYAEVSLDEFEPLKKDISIHILADINTKTEKTYSVNKLSMCLWSLSTIYFLIDILTTFPDVNMLSVGTLTFLIIMKDYLLQTRRK